MEVVLYDTTPSDGAQQEGISFSFEDKVKFVRHLDRLGIGYVEGGWPRWNPKDMAFFRKLSELRLEQATVTPFGSTCRVGVSAGEDPNLRAFLAANTRTVAIFGKSWDLHVLQVLHAGLEENLRMIAASVRLMRVAGREVIYDADHFFDGYRAHPAGPRESLSESGTPEP